MSRRIDFNVVKVYATRDFSCAKCGRPARRSRTFQQTTNPFNRNQAGFIKSRDQIRMELSEQAAKWEPTMHASCES